VIGECRYAQKRRMPHSRTTASASAPVV
jgi:hypothetical protein